jgi:DNA-binding NarL/FixJ family response regulator
VVDIDDVDRRPEAGRVSSAPPAGAAADTGSGRDDRQEIARAGITVVIADDQPLMRSALRMCLSPEPDIEVVGEARDGEEAVALANRLRPDVVIMDIRMPVLDGVAATRQLTTGRADPIRVLIITAFDLDEYIVEALRLGASGFLVKDAEPAELVHAIRVIAAGDAVLAPTITKRLLDLLGHELPPPRLASPMPTQLTTREQTVLQLIAEGRSNREIGRALFLADSTVKSHVGHLLAKLGLTDRIHLVIFAYNNALLRPATSATPCTERRSPDHTSSTGYASVFSPAWTNGSPSATPWPG